MRTILLAILASFGAAVPAFGVAPAPAPKFTVEVTAEKEAKASVVKALASAVRTVQGVEGRLDVYVPKTGAITARLRVAPETGYRALVRLLGALKAAGVGAVTLDLQ